MRQRIPKALVTRFRTIEASALVELESCLREHYFDGADPWYASAAYLASAEGRKDLHDHVSGRLTSFRHTVIPWLDDALPLEGARILEIGCGTGSSTVALAEQGAQVTGVDIIEESLIVAKRRCELHGVSAQFVQANATDVHEVFAGEAFDFILFFATLEHMTNAERLQAIEHTWHMLPPGRLWCVIETPNRLWHFDHHTSLLPFYHWLPDDLAFLYSRFSPRTPFRDLYRESTPGAQLDFLRRGRGVSYHELEFAMGRAEEINVVSSLSGYLRSVSVPRRMRWALSRERALVSRLARVGPNIHRGFYCKSLDLIIQKR